MLWCSPNRTTASPCAVPTPGAQRPSDAGRLAKCEEVARPTGVERADARNIRISIEGADIGLMAEGA